MSIIIRNLTKIFPPNKKEALKNVSMEFKNNQITGLIGFNGSGKTTTFNILSQCIANFDSGECTFDGKTLDLETRRKICYLTSGQERKNSQSAIAHFNIIANIYGADSQWTKDKIYYYAKKFEFLKYLKTSIKFLSKGNQQKIKIISSFLNPDCKYMFLDEPFEGLDPIMVSIVQEEYSKLKNTTIIISSHLMGVVDKMVNDFYIIKDGEIVDFNTISNNKEVVVRVNKEVLVKAIEKLSFVLNIDKTSRYTDITISNKKYFPEINKKLVMMPNYKYSSIIKKSITSAAFEKYRGNHE